MYTINAKKENLPSRSYFKIEEIDKKYNLFHSHQKNLDLGSCPGGWSYYLKQKSREVHASDLLNSMKTPVDKFILGDFLDQNLWGNFDVYQNIVSDMAINSTGNKWLDNYKNHALALEVWDFVQNHLENNGNFVIKLFESEYTKIYIDELKKQFKKIYKYKPSSSHKDSSEFYLVSIKYKRHTRK